MRIGWVLLLIVAVVAAAASQAATIHEAIDQGDSAAVAAMLEANPALLGERLPNGRTPLHTAAYSGKLNIVELLLARGADVNAKTTAGAVPLHGAALYGHEAIVQRLVAKGAIVNVANQAGYTPLTNAASATSLPMLKCLIEAGAKVNPASDSEQVPLISAANRCWLEGIEYLLSAGADANKVAGDHGDAVTTTVLTVLWKLDGSERAADILRVLLKYGADPNYTFPSGITTLMHAARTDDTTILQVLLDAGAKPDAVADIGISAFGWAVEANCLNSVRYLIGRNACKLSVETVTGRTQLHRAVMQGSLPLVQAVLAVTANPSAVDSLGFTPLDMAYRYGHKQIADLLKSDGAITRAQMKQRPFTSYLAEQPAEGEAYLWYLGNCGYLIKTRNHCLVFDYWTGNMRPTEPSLANGFITPAELASENVTAFVTHEHVDHYDSTIFGWEGKFSGLRYVFGFKPESLDVRFAQGNGQGYAGQSYEYVGPHMSKTVDGMQISAVRSNDAGVGYVVKVDGVTIFHAGDLAGWLPEQREGFTSQIDSIDAAFDDVDIALVNVTGCHHQDTIALAEGTAYTLAKLRPKLVIPTHGSGREHYYRKFMNKFSGEFPNLRAFCPIWRGDAVKFTGGKGSSSFELL